MTKQRGPRDVNLFAAVGQSATLRALAAACCVASATGGAGASYAGTPAWRIVIILLAFVVISVAVELAFHHFDHAMTGKMTESQRMKNAGLIKTVDKAKEELMLMGFLSFLLLLLADQQFCTSMTSDGDPFNAVYQAQKSGRECETVSALTCCSDAPSCGDETFDACGSSRRALASSAAAEPTNVTACCVVAASTTTHGTYVGGSFTGHDFSTTAENLIVVVDGTSQTIALSTNLATAAAAAAVINGLTGATAAVESHGYVLITCSSSGTSSTVAIGSGSGANALALFGSGTATAGHARRRLGASSSASESGCCVAASRRVLEAAAEEWEPPWSAGQQVTWSSNHAGEGELSGSRRQLASSAVGCPAGQENFISQNALHQTHVLIFLIAIIHVLYSFFMIRLARVTRHTAACRCRTAALSSQCLNEGLLSQTRVKRYDAWEKFGDDADEVRAIIAFHSQTFAVRLFPCEPGRSGLFRLQDEDALAESGFKEPEKGVFPAFVNQLNM